MIRTAWYRVIPPGFRNSRRSAILSVPFTSRFKRNIAPIPFGQRRVATANLH
jgi:hypothetical protein